MEENDVLELDGVRSNEPEGGRKTDLSSPDLSFEIAQTVERQAGDRVRCRRVGPSTYRCNWLAVDHSRPGEGVMRFLETYMIRDSKFLRATKVDGRLMIEDWTVQAVRSN